MLSKGTSTTKKARNWKLEHWSWFKAKQKIVLIFLIKKEKQNKSKLYVVCQFEIISGFFIVKFFIEEYYKDFFYKYTLLWYTNSSQTIRSLILSVEGNVFASAISFILVRCFPVKVWICLKEISVTTAHESETYNQLLTLIAMMTYMSWCHKEKLIKYADQSFHLHWPFYNMYYASHQKVFCRLRGC